MNHERQQKAQARELNNVVTTYLAPSKVHGVGVFALRDLKQGQKLYADLFPKMYNLRYDYFEDLVPEIKEKLLERWPNIVNGSNFGYPDTNIQAFMNHSETPNYDALNDILLADVQKGEEITEDYRMIPNWDKVFDFIKK